MTGVSLTLARKYLALGLSVIPIRPRSKQPDCEWKTYQTSHPTDADLQRWFDAGDRNAGIVLGAVSGVVVIESDNSIAEAWCRDTLPTTPLMTRSARGAHRYYKLPQAFEHDGSSLPARVGGALNVELKRDGQYVLAPGSVHPTGMVYSMVQEWPATLQDVPILPVEALLDNGRSNSKPPLPSRIPAGQRNDNLWTEACRMRRLGLDSSEIYPALEAINNNRCNPPLPDKDVHNLARRAARYDTARDLFPITESGDAEFFAASNANALRFDHRQGRWLLFTGHLWTPQRNGEIPRFALDAIRARQRAAVGDKKRLEWGLHGESRRRLINLVALAQNLRPLADDGEAWDVQPFLLGVGNGVVDLQTGTLRAGTPSDRITLQTQSIFDPKATCPTWERFLSEVFVSDAELPSYIQRALGYSLTGDCREECLFFCWGNGANGKGTLMNTFAQVIGQYADDLPFNALELHEHRSGIPNDIAKLVGKRYVTASESGEASRLNEARVKALTGRDPITARFLHREFFTFQPVAKFWLATNNRPIVRDESEGFWRRLHLIPFTESFIGREDKTLKDRLRAEAEGILAWAVRGALEWQHRGLQPPASVLRATNEYRRQSEVLAPFYDECCVIARDARVQSGILFKRYERWFESSRLPSTQRLNVTTFGKQVRLRFAVEEKRNTTYLGIGMRNGQQTTRP